ncbi:MAG: hypothetical protein AB7O32_11555 [Vicinamibacterales bacterium]
MSRLLPSAFCPGRWSRRVLASCLAVVAIGCGKSEDPAPPVATPTVTLNHDRAAAGSPLEITYRFVVAEGASLDKDYRVMAHMVDTDEELMWTDDHLPPTPTSQWKPGQTIEYTRTIFVPVFPYVGQTNLLVGLYSTADQKRLPLTGQDMGQRAYRAATFEMLPQTENLFAVYKEGWHPAEQADGGIEWQWTKKEATLAFKNPKKDVAFYLDLDSPGKELHGPQQVQVNMGGQTLDEFTVQPDTPVLRKMTLPAARMGDLEMAELQVVVDTTFVPSLVGGSTSSDKRELGVRVFHAFVDPR